MSEKKPTPRGFKAWPENEERLEFAANIGLNVSEVINEVLAKYLKPTLEAKTRKMREQLAAPVP